MKNSVYNVCGIMLCLILLCLCFKYGSVLAWVAAAAVFVSLEE